MNCSTAKFRVCCSQGCGFLFCSAISADSASKRLILDCSGQIVAFRPQNDLRNLFPFCLCHPLDSAFIPAASRCCRDTSRGHCQRLRKRRGHESVGGGGRLVQHATTGQSGLHRGQPVRHRYVILVSGFLFHLCLAASVTYHHKANTVQGKET